MMVKNLRMQLDKKWEKLINGKEDIKEYKTNSEKIRLNNSKRYLCYKIK